jgi:hypothetical protein
MPARLPTSQPQTQRLIGSLMTGSLMTGALMTGAIPGVGLGVGAGQGSREEKS